MTKCVKCGSEYKVSKRYLSELCRKCKRENSIIEKYGSIDNFNKQRNEKTKQTHINNYGVEWPQQLDEVKKKQEQTNIEKYGTKCSAHNEHILEKIKQTNINKYGVKNSNSAEEVKSNKARVWGSNSPFRLNSVKEKSIKTKEKKYGDKNFNNRQKAKETCLEHYGVEIASQSNEIKQKTILTKIGKSDKEKKEIRNKQIKTCLERYGVETFTDTYKFIYNGKSFDSSWELYYYIYLMDNNIDFIYKPKPGLKYKIGEKIHYYYPDFIVENRYHEIKGEQFLKNNKLYDYKNQKYLFEKQQCMVCNNIKLLRFDYIKTIIKWVENEYGDNYIQQFRRK